MPVSSIDWRDKRRSRGYDIHLLRGHGASIRLDQQLMVFGSKTNPDGTETNLGGFTADSLPASFEVEKVEFAPRFPSLTGQGISVDATTGVVNASAATPASLRNFLVKASVDHKTAGLPDPLETFIRVHVHTSVAKAWLTPRTLTVHKDSRPPDKAELFRLTLLAQFDDGTLGDISEVPGITWTPAPGSGQAAVVLPTGDIRIDSFPGDVTVRATLPAAWGGAVAEGTVLARGPWVNLLPNPSAVLRSGPGFDRFNEVPNVLFIPDGFLDTNDDREAFEEILTKTLDTIRRSKIARPFDLFFNSHQKNYTDSINYWSVFLPSRERANSVLAEMRITVQPNTGEIEGIPVPEATPLVSAGAWTLAELIFQVGLPVPDDVNHQDLGQRIQGWKNLFGAAQIPDGKVTEPVFGDWINHSPRRLVNERDTVLFTSAGERPRVIERSPPRSLALHPLRTRRGHLNQFLETLTDSQGPVIGPAWTTGKDRHLVFALVAGAPPAGAFSSDGVITTALGHDRRIILKAVDPAVAAQQGTNALDLLPYELSEGWPLGVRLRSQTVGTILHELSHAFSLGDEYGADGFVLPNSSRRFHTEDGNLQPERDLEATANAGDLDGSKLRWRWPRIKKAGVLTEPPFLITPGPPREYILPLRIGHKLLFKDGDTVFLRQRPLLKPSTKAQPDRINPAKVSGPLQVVSTIQLLEQIVVRDSAGTLNPADFPVKPNEEPIVFAPHAAQPADDDAELVAKVIREHITATRLPLNRRVAACARDDNTEQTATNTPANLDFPSLWVPRNWIVGAFDGGATFYCGIYHPTGDCMMRSSSESGSGDLRRLCPVCRYLLVDRVDPSLHDAIDRAYSSIYPAR